MLHRFVPRPFLAVLVMVVAVRITPAVADVAAGVSYTVPAGWAAADKDGLRILAPSNLKSGELMVAMVAGVQPATGSPDEQLAGLAATYNSDAKVVASTAAILTDRGAVGKLYVKSFDVKNTDMGAHTRMLAILVRGDLRAVVLFVFTNNAVLRAHGAGVQELLASLSIAASPGSLPAPVSSPAAPAAATNATKPTSTDGHLPTGDTPGFMGSPGWLPSGRGVKIPSAPRVVKGRPEGLWWRYQASSTTMFPLLMVYLPDGTYASNPRFGSGALFDVDGQRKQAGTTGVGTFTMNNGKISTAADGFTRTDTFKSGADKDGPWFEIGAARHYPLEQVPAKTIVGTWKSPSGKYVFRADGTFESGNVMVNSEVTVAQGSRGTWQADGYLLAIRPSQGAAWITTVGRTGKFLIVGQTVYTGE